MTNRDVARQLQLQARKLAERYGNLYRVRAYRRAAETVLGLPRAVTDLQKSDLEVLPGIGNHLALAITHYTRTGEWKTYEELTAGDMAV